VITARIVRDLVGVLATVQFDDDGAIEAGKVANVETNLVLASKLEPVDLASPKAAPEEPFCVC